MKEVWKASIGEFVGNLSIRLKLSAQYTLEHYLKWPRKNWLPEVR